MIFFFFGIDRKPFKFAVWWIDSAMQQSGSLNQLSLRFVVETLTLEFR